MQRVKAAVFKLLCFVTGSDNDLVLRQILHEPVFDGETLLHKASRVRPGPRL